MSQEGGRRTPQKSPSRIPVPSKSPSRIPIPTGFSSQSSQKRPANQITTRSSRATTTAVGTTTAASALSGFKRLEALAKAEVKNRNQSVITSSQPTKNVPWVEKHLPQSLEDLFVHKKKTEEVLHWLSRTFNHQNAPKICVLSGPSGCGKTATVYLAAKSLDAEVKDWVNPMSLTQFRPGGNDGFRDDFHGRNQLDLFTDFLFRTSQYRSLPMKNKSVMKYRLTLVEDIPNAFYRDPDGFHEMLRKYAKTGMSPLVFIFTDTASSEHGFFRMFPKTLLTELNILNISFNPVASSYIVKFLLGVCAKESIPVDKSMVEDIAATTNGDLRCALNNLQFYLTKERGSSSSSSATFRKPLNKRARKQDTMGSASAVSEVQQKDETIQLFRALGKVLYAKRDETVISENEMQLVGEMESERRVHPLIENPESICDRVGVSTDTFLSFMHQNYPAFYGSLDDMKNAAEYLSTGDFIVSGWKFDDSGCKAFKVREVKEQVAMSIAIRGLMHSNNNRVSVGWKPLTKPTVSNLENMTRDSIESTRQALFHLRELQTTLFTEAIPFYAKLLQLNTSFKPEGRKEILEKGLFEQKRIRIIPLDEKETVEDTNEATEPGDMQEESDENDVQNRETEAKIESRDLNANIKDDVDEEFIIEEFDE